MALEIANFIEDKTWNEWSIRLRILEKYNFRKNYYPGGMDEHTEIVKMFTKQRRDSVKMVAKDRKNIVSNYSKMTYEEKQQYYARSKEISHFDNNIWYYVRNKTIQAYIENVVLLEKVRLDIILETMMPRVQLEKDENQMVEFIKKIDDLNLKETTKKNKEKQQNIAVRKSKRIQEKRVTV